MLASSTHHHPSSPDRKHRPETPNGNSPKQKSKPTPGPIKLSPYSSTCPYIPLLSSGTTSSPPAVTSTLAYGSNSGRPTTPGCRGRDSSKGEGSPRHASDPENSSAGFPWDLSIDHEQTNLLQQHLRTTASRKFPLVERRMSASSSATELTDTRSRPSNKVLNHNRSHSASHSGAKVTTSPKSSPKSSMRLKLPPPPQLLDALGIGVRNEGDQEHRLRQSLLGLAFPTTPDTGINIMPVCADGNGGGNNSGGMEYKYLHPASRIGGVGTEGHGGGGATAALLAANPHLASRSFALLTPPDDNGVLEWQGFQTDGVSVSGNVMGQNVSVGQLSGFEDVDKDSEIGTLVEDTDPIPTTVRLTPNGGKEGSEEQVGGDDMINEKGKEIVLERVEQKPKNDTTSEQFAEEGWLRNALDVLLDDRLPVQMGMECCRILSYALPCPLPASANDSAIPSAISSVSHNSGKLPASAASAPTVAAAAGHQLSPAITARCNNKGTEDSRFLPPMGSRYPGDDGVTTGLNILTNAIQKRYSRDRAQGNFYIHVSHAISPHIPFNRLPSTTPPLSGGAVSAGGSNDSSVGAGSGGGYFAAAVFNSIVVAQSGPLASPDSGGISNHHPPIAMPSPNPILPPSSLHLTLLERYIPPNSAGEHESMFSTSSSILLDRLFELSPQGGSLLFIYPTRTGAKCFDREYLGPVMDPLLRKLMVLYALREDLLWGLRNMAAVEKMDEFEVLRGRVDKFCRRLSGERSPGLAHYQKAKGVKLPKIPLEMAFAAKTTITLNDMSWREWWTQQEQTRIREVVKRHSSKMPSSQSGSAHPTITTSSVCMAHTKSSSGSSTQSTLASSAASASSGFSVGYGVPEDLARSVLDGVRAPAIRPSSRGMGEAVLASAMSGSQGGGGGSGGVGGIVGEMDGFKNFGRRPERDVEVGVFVLRRVGY
ncbi:hypothetical protein RUND412_008684 [Rhizina undulata]